MELPPVLAVVLVVAGLWNIVVWPPFLRKAIADPASREENGAMTRSLMVTLMLISTSMVFGLATAIIGVRALMG
ncbi:hypothetical protein BN1051_00844 [Arthrobacter saudimassiliensis]|uniref:Uncharacterized protein n=1 Tax=Arthrobacter saudimassiliensis TaxID=1461584 RepID=A0A078MMK7_9MICC|nr:hypothetical protein BN1051_00844 [Arthrobacter saudimassiliensis]